MDTTTRRHVRDTRSGQGWTTCVLAVGLGLLAGCLLPQDDTLLDEPPRFMNRSPRIIESLVLPQERIIQDFGASRCELTFEVAVEDPDVDDRIKVHWFIDYSPQDPRGPYREIALTNNGEARRPDRGTLRINLASANSVLSTPGQHLVEALVSDAELTDRQPESQVVNLPDGGSIIDPGFVISYSWVVTTVQGDCR
ncbi:hypothetical protein HUW62_40810 [Myxococcus sp. AM011]|uniref:hypothetical protein n=1 Tax=Myxococcus sp. AM011 TaxID=2745200 RepID=UPI00159594AF|nr:hypothetical protein [Myxococcus sp. AM011]NVJ27574.1 hypothetical protein [Myxococcus sp. AM011]